MVLESIGLNLPWHWSSGQSSSSSSHDKKKSKKRSGPVRTRSEQQKARHNGNGHVPEDEEAEYYPGLINVSGTYCFMNSTLQAMASLSYLQPQLDAVHDKAEALDIPSPVIDSLQDLLHTLNTPKSSPHSFRPMDMIHSLSSRGKSNSLFSSRDHQDAQELFQLITECIKNETAAIEKEGRRDRGLGGLHAKVGTVNGGGKSVFDGLTANRRSCVQCGYTEAVMHFAFDNWQLAVPRMAGSCTLEDCLADYTRLELLTDCICRKCSMLATHKRLLHDAEKLSNIIKTDPKASESKKKRAKEAKKLARIVQAALDEGRIEEELKGVKMEKVFSPASTKQAMIGRPPPVLALHINRSVHFGAYASKNNVRVQFPEILDLTPYTTSGQLSTAPSAPISSPPPPIPRSTTPTPAAYATPRTIYRLAAVVCHYGNHSYGHYVCYRRKPRPASLGPFRFEPPRLEPSCDPLSVFAPGSQEVPPWANELPAKPGRGWLRISDDASKEVGLESVLAEGSGAFMLYYEKVVLSALAIGVGHAGMGSDETLRQKDEDTDTLRSVHHANGSVTSLASVFSAVKSEGEGLMVKSEILDMEREKREKEGMKKMSASVSVIGPRLVRSVTATSRGRSVSVAPSDGRGGSLERGMQELQLKEEEDASLPLTSPPKANGHGNGHGNGHAVKAPTPLSSLPSSPPKPSSKTNGHAHSHAPSPSKIPRKPLSQHSPPRYQPTPVLPSAHV